MTYDLKTDIIKKMNHKINCLERDLISAKEGFDKIQGLVIGSYYELYYPEVYHLVQCTNLGRDHVEFIILASPYTQKEFGGLLIKNKTVLSLGWGWIWTYIEADLKIVTAKYLSCAWITPKFSRLLKKGLK